MSARIRFVSSAATDLVLAKVGNPQRQEPLQTSKTVFKIAEADQALLTSVFLRPFKNLIGHRFKHHSSLDQHEMNQCAKAIFENEESLLERGCQIANRLYSKSNHPNIKSGDLCISLIENIEVNAERTNGICILKSESVMPFLSIIAKDGDLQLTTEHGINPEKIDKGCLIINHEAEKGYLVLMFDRAGAESRFWVRDFLGVVPQADGSFLTNQYAQLAASFVEKETRASGTPEEACTAAREALAYFDDQESFDLKDFEEKVLKTPAVVAKFTEHRAMVEQEQGLPLPESFEISKKDVTKAKKKIHAVVKLDTGVEIHLKPGSDTATPLLERGFDDRNGMKFIKIYYNRDLSGDGVN